MSADKRVRHVFSHNQRRWEPRLFILNGNIPQPRRLLPLPRTVDRLAINRICTRNPAKKEERALTIKSNYVEHVRRSNVVDGSFFLRFVVDDMLNCAN